MGTRSVLMLRMVAGCLALAAAGCDKSALRSADVTQPVGSSQSESAILRTVHDAGRQRIWILNLNGYVRVHDAQNKALLRHIDLTDWLAVKTPCMPDLILDEEGSAWVSSNVRPWLWRIAGNTFELEVRQMTMPGREQLDIGFGTLAFAPDGTLRGMSPVANSIWRIEQGRGSATIDRAYQTPLEGCGLPD
jgi:hypothetical protein